MEHLQRVEGEFVKRGVVPGRHIKPGSDTKRVTVGRQEAVCEPQVELVRDGDVIQAIDVICSCGQRIRLRCVY